MWVSIVMLVISASVYADGGRLYTQGTVFMKDGHRVFLSGANLAWIHYAYDFGNGFYQGVASSVERYLSELEAAGGNSMRVWVHVEGESTPKFDSNGYVTGTDNGYTLISDMRSLLRAAQRHGILIFFVLWNGAKKQSYHYRLHGLIVDTNKLQSYIDHALVPMVNQLKNEPALGGWEVINEPEGELKPGLNSNDNCHKTTQLTGPGAGWQGHLYTPQELQRFINWQADAIRRTDPQAQVTVGVWNPKSNTDQWGFHNLWSDHCLKSTGGRSAGILTFYQFHTYDFHSHWDGYSPMQKSMYEYGLNKPVVIGEFRQSEGGGLSIQNMFNHAYYYGYAGAWSWQANDNSWGNQKTGISWIKDKNDQSKGGLVNFSV